MSQSAAGKPNWPWDSTVLSLCLQSPVNIQESTAEATEFPPLCITVPNDPSTQFTIKSEGHGVAVTFEDPKARRMYLTGAFLGECYCLENVHYHWGETNELGSEHFVNGESFAGEVHLVTYKKEYKNFDTAVQNEDGVVIVCFFLQVGEKNENFEKFLCSVGQLNDSKGCGGGGVKGCGTDTVYWFGTDLCKTNKSYLTYPGSLTGPPFTEIITFAVLPCPVQVSEDQMNVFRTVTDEQDQPITSNRREMQPLKQRPILCGGQVTFNL